MNHTWAHSYLAMHGLNTSSSTEQVGALNIGRIFWYYIFMNFAFI